MRLFLVSSNAASSRSDTWVVMAGGAAGTGLLATGISELVGGAARCNRHILTQLFIPIIDSSNLK